MSQFLRKFVHLCIHLTSLSSVRVSWTCFRM